MIIGKPATKHSRARVLDGTQARVQSAIRDFICAAFRLECKVKPGKIEETWDWGLATTAETRNVGLRPAAQSKALRIKDPPSVPPKQTNK